MQVIKKISALVLTAVLAVSSAFACAVPAYAQDYNSNGATLTASWDTKTKKLSLNPNGVLFDADNIVPGDRINSQVVIKNETGTDVTVALVRVENTNNTKPDLYQYMTTTITQGNQSLYAGNMVNGTTGPVTQAVPLAKGDTKTVYISVTLPDNVGNEAQGGVLNTNWVWQVYMDKEPITDSGNTIKQEPVKVTQTVEAPIQSSANKGIQSGVDDVFHSEDTKVILGILIVAFAAIVLMYIKTTADDKKKGTDVIDGECEAVEDNDSKSDNE